MNRYLRRADLIQPLRQQIKATRVHYKIAQDRAIGANSWVEYARLIDDWSATGRDLDAYESALAAAIRRHRPARARAPRKGFA